MSERLPVTVIGGYLGAGKTTLVNHLLRSADGLKLAVLVNEFGALAIDEDLIEAQEDDLISIAGGCVCCSFGSDLTAALLEMGAREPRPDHVVIEASGVAMPRAIAANVGLQDGFRLAGIVVLADSETIRAQAVDDYLGDTVLRQLADADLVVQTKVDLVETTGATAGWLEDHAPNATVLQAEQGRVPRDVLLGLETTLVTTVTPEPTAHADAGFESAVFTPYAGCDAEKLARALATGDYGVVRAKGFVHGAGGEVLLIQTVGQRYDVMPFAREMPAEIVCIGLKERLAVERLEELFSQGYT